MDCIDGARAPAIIPRSDHSVSVFDLSVVTGGFKSGGHHAGCPKLR